MPAATAISHTRWASALQAPINPFAPSALSEAEIEQTIADFCRCAALAQQAGYDGVEVMGSEGYLINQFWRAPTSATIAGRQLHQPHALRRRDRTGGTRQAVGAEFILIYRLSMLDLGGRRLQLAGD